MKKAKSKKKWDSVERKTEALRRMEVDLTALAKMPPIGEMLREVKRSDLIGILRLSDDPVLITFLDVYDSLPLVDRDCVPLEAILVRSGQRPNEFLGSAELCLREYSAHRVKILGIAAHPGVMEKTIQFAGLPAGIKDRENLHTMLGALQPQKAGVSLFQKFVGVTPQGAQPNQPSQPAPVEMESDANYVFPDSTKMQERLSAVRQKLLESGR